MKTATSVIKIRKLAAIDIALIGYGIIAAEFAFGVMASLGLGVFVLFRGHSAAQTVLGMYLLCIGINYVPLLLYTITIRNRGNARLEMGDELNDKARTMSRYRTQSLLLLVPLAVAILAIVQAANRGRSVTHPA